MELKTRKKTFWEVLSEHSVSKVEDSYVDVYLEWTCFGYIGGIPWITEMLERKGYECINASRNKCVCGAKIKYKYLIMNPLTKKYAIIGSCCKDRFFAPNPGGRKSALAYIMHDLKSKLDVLERLGSLDELKQTLKELLNITIYYIEKQTKYKRNLKVSRRFVRLVEEFTGVKWKWEVWK